MLVTIKLKINDQKVSFDLRSSIGEPPNYFKERIKFIVAQENFSGKLLDTSITYSHIYVNHKFKQCVYSDEVMEELATMIKKYENVKLECNFDF